jgi:hypothetical protein
MPADFALLPWLDARAILGDRPLRMRVLTPPYPAVGIGTLRCLRLQAPSESEAWELVLGYDGYERIV